MLRAIACALGFLTRIPVPARVVDDATFARSAGYFSAVGALLGALVQLSAFALTPLVGARIGGVLLVAGLAYVTGGLHLDGLADTADGLSGGRGQRERTLAIMRDSRIGAHGALALGLALLLKAELFTSLANTRALWLAPTFARFTCTVLLALFPYARPEGLGASFAGRVGAREVVLGALPLGAVPWLLPAYTWVALAVALGCALLFAWRVARFLGGLTGDVHGAAIELTELTVLLGMVALAPFS